MTTPLALEQAALTLAAAMAAETTALEAGDYAAAIRAAPEKARAMEAFLAARATQGGAPAGRSRGALESLRQAALANRIALERAINVQGRIIELLARAAQRQPDAPGGYGLAAARPAAAAPVALSVKL